jgi:hypothetical protein
MGPQIRKNTTAFTVTAVITSDLTMMEELSTVHRKSSMDWNKP